MRFVILSPSRSGSTMLRMGLLAHPQISCHGEILSPRRPRGLVVRDIGLEPDEARRLHAEDPAEMVRRALGAEPHRGKTAFGFKLLYSQIAARSAIVEALAADREIGVVDLWRRDLCARYISERKYALAVRKRPRSREVAIDPDDLARDVERQTTARARVLQTFAGHPRIEVVYEDLVAAGDATPVARFLGVEGEVPLPDLRLGLQDLPAVTVVNEAELRAAYAS